MTRIVHLAIGPAQHGVVRHATAVAQACRHELWRWPTPDEDTDLPRCDVVHVPYTDRLFGPTVEEAGTAFDRVAALVRRAGAELSVTLHDVPHDSSELQRRRRAGYRRVIAAARGVVVNSRVELSLVEDLADSVHSLRLAPLPVVRGGRPTRAPTAGADTVAVLGFIYPDKGYEDVIAALPARTRLLAIGRPADGHEDLPGRYAALANGSWTSTGYVDDADLADLLWGVAVPVAPNRRVTASASINTWLAHHRRPLVPDGPYTRELLADRPDAVTRYEPNRSSLRQAIDRALADPRSTWLGDDAPTGPSLEYVAAIYRQHLDACAPPAVLFRFGTATIPGNRWDLLTPTTGQPAPPVSVVIPYFEAQHQLDRTLAALTLQTHPAHRFEVIVVDDGSRRAPSTACAGDLSVRVLRQPDRGFRAARARNLGAATADGDIIAFLDADTVPEPQYLARLVQLPQASPDVLAVGRRRHADLAAVGPGDLADWWAGRITVAELTEPEWLSSAYQRSQNLLRADRRSYRYVLSAVLALSRALFDQAGGFDDRFVGYGGEDWELAHRCWQVGAIFAHARDAVAWHDGPDWAARDVADPTAAKNDETTILATLLPDPTARGGGQWQPYPAAVIQVSRMTTADLLATARTAFDSGLDCGIWITEISGHHADLVLADARLHRGQPSRDVLRRAGYVIELDGRTDLGQLADLCRMADRHGEIRTPAARITASRALRRAARWAGDGDADEVSRLSGYLFGRHDRAAPEPLAGPGLDLAAHLRELHDDVRHS